MVLINILPCPEYNHASDKMIIENYRDTYKDLEDKYNILQSDYDDLSVKYASLESEKESLQSQINSYETGAKSNNASSSSGSSRGGSTGSFGSSSSGSSTMVWIPATGSKYHNKSNCGNMNPNTATQVTKSEAESMGYDPCKKCY